MDKVPGTKKSELEKAEAALKAEVEAWNNLGMSLDQTQHPNSSIFALRLQVQTIINIMLEKNLVTNEEFNIEFKKLVLADMKQMREANEPEIREQRRQAIVGGARPPIAVPHLRLIGPDGKDLKI